MTLQRGLSATADLLVVPVETEMNILQFHYLMAWWPHNCITLYVTRLRLRQCYTQFETTMADRFQECAQSKAWWPHNCITLYVTRLRLRQCYTQFETTMADRFQECVQSKAWWPHNCITLYVTRLRLRQCYLHFETTMADCFQECAQSKRLFHIRSQDFRCGAHSFM